MPPAKIRPPVVRGLERERLSNLAGLLGDHRLVTVVAPAGSGKTTLLSQLAARSGRPVAWYWAESSDGDPDVLLRGLAASFAALLPGSSRPWRSVEDAAAALDGLAAPALLVVDDLHVLGGTASEPVLEQLLHYAPRELTMVVGTRATPGFNLSRLRVAGSLLEIGPDELRFRSWEVERLFHQFYGEPLPPEDLAALARRTEGWAAGLQLFHLATRGKPPGERRRTLDALGVRSSLVREYLTGNVLEDLPAELREFLVGTCVLGRLSGALCDRLLGERNSARMLEELERRQIFTYALEDGEWYRYHEVLRSHLEAVLVERLGESGARERFRRAGELLENAGALPEALRAYCRAEDWEAVPRLLGGRGEQLVERPAAWVDVVPSSLARQDPWLMLAGARRKRAAGRLAEALASYQASEAAFGAASGAQLARQERRSLAAWTDPMVVPADDWAGLLREAVSGDPAAVRRRAGKLEGPSAQLAGGLAALLAGHAGDAARLLTSAAEDPDASASLSAGARLGGAVARLLGGDATAVREAELAAEDAEGLNLSWLARAGRAALALGDRPDGRSEAAAVRMAAERDGDHWGVALASLMEGWGALRRGQDAGAPLERAVEGFRRLSAPVPEAWARSLAALDLSRGAGPEAREAALQAETFARNAGVRGAQAIAYLALAEVDPGRGEEYRTLARAIALECGLDLPLSAGDGSAGTGEHGSDGSRLRCFGGLSLELSGRPIELAQLKPRARRALRLLALHAGHPVHRERLTEALWPEVDDDTGRRNLHVVVSSLRHVLDRGVPEGSTLVVREDDTYRLQLPPGTRVDVAEFRAAEAEGHRAVARGDADAAVASLQSVLELYAGDLLPEEGAVDWVVEERERCRGALVNAAGALGEILLERGDARAAAAVCERGLHVDRYRDSLWRLLIAAHDAAGDHAAAARVRAGYEDVLAELGVEEPAVSAR